MELTVRRALLMLVALVAAALGVREIGQHASEAEAECLMACEQEREECRGSPLLVEPPTPEARQKDSMACLPAEADCREGC